MSSFNETELNCIRWGEARGIVQNSTAKAQAIKTQEEINELLDALDAENDDETKDAIGDIMVTLVMICAVKGWDLKQCFAGAYDQIKNRKGHLGVDGIWVKA